MIDFFRGVLTLALGAIIGEAVKALFANTSTATIGSFASRFLSDPGAQAAFLSLLLMIGLTAGYASRWKIMSAPGSNMIMMMWGGMIIGSFLPLAVALLRGQFDAISTDLKESPIKYVTLMTLASGWILLDVIRIMRDGRLRSKDGETPVLRKPSTQESLPK